MHMYNYVYMHIGKYTGYANTPEIKHGEKGDRRKTKWTCSHHWNEVSEWSSVRPFTFSACSLVWGVFTTNGLSFAMQLLDLHFLTMSRWLCQLAFRAWCSGVVPLWKRRAALKGRSWSPTIVVVNNAPVRNIEATHGFTQFMSRWQISWIGEWAYAFRPSKNWPCHFHVCQNSRESPHGWRRARRLYCTNSCSFVVDPRD